MRKNSLLMSAALVAAGFVLVPSAAVAQTTNAPAPAPVRAGPPPGALRGQPHFNPTANSVMSVRPAVFVLNRVMAELQRTDNDFDGHRQAAIDACEKARAELMEVAKSAGIPMPPDRGAPGMMMQRQHPVPAAAPPGKQPAPATPANAQ